MNLTALKNATKDMAFQNRLLKAARFIELGVIVALICLLYTQETIVTVTPPNMDIPVSITRNTGDENYKQVWGYFTADLIGNVSPENVDFVMSSLKEILSPALYIEVSASLKEQTLTIQNEELATQFSITGVEYVKSLDRVYVSGKHSTKGPYGDPDVQYRTYEFQIGVRNYKPEIRFFDVYPGGPKNEQDKKREKLKEQKQKKNQ